MKRKTARDPRVTVIITTYSNRKKDVLENIASVENSDYKNIKIILINDCSTDDTKSVVEKRYPHILIISNEKNMGASYSRNVGIRTALEEKTDYILFLDSDVVIDRKAIRLLVESIDAYTELGAATPTVRYFEDKTKIQYSLVSIGLITGINKTPTCPNTSLPVETQCSGGNILIKIKVAKKVGFFDPVYFIYYEDADYSLRIWEAGYKIMYVPQSIIYHKMPILSAEESTKRWVSHAYLTARNKIIFMKKHGKNFLLFTLFYPIYLAYYIYTALRLKDTKALTSYIKGALSGFTWTDKHL